MEIDSKPLSLDRLERIIQLKLEQQTLKKERMKRSRNVFILEFRISRNWEYVELEDVWKKRKSAFRSAYK